LKDSINKARDLTTEEVRKAEERITQQWKTEKETLVQTFFGLADAMEKVVLQQVQIRNLKVSLDFQGISAMNIVKDGRIFSRGEDGEKANEVIVSVEAQIEEAKPSQAEAKTGADDKDGGAGSPTSTQVP